MNIRVSDIYHQKLESIQSRIPVKLFSTPSTANFQQILDREMHRTTETAQTSINHLPLGKSRQMQYIEKIVDAAGKKYNIHPNLIKSIIKAESDFDPEALSPVGAQGLMQLMPGTARALGVKNPWNIAQNIDGGVKYFSEQLKKFNGDVELALAAYNAGPNSVIKYDGIPPYKETQNYIKKVYQYWDEYNENK